MLRVIKTTSLVAGLLLLAGVSFAQAPASAPAGSTGLCKDGTYWSGATKKGACHGHKGVQTWYAATDSGSASAPATAAVTGAAVAAPAATASVPAPAPTKPTPKPSSAGTAAATQAAPGGGPGMVWVNKSSKVYHCPSDRWYGKTKEGAYMSEADAKAQGNRPDHGKVCQ